MAIDASVLHELEINNSSIYELDLSYQNLNVDDMSQLVAKLVMNTHLRKINVSGNTISNEGIKLLVSSELNITTLVASDCGITSIELMEPTSKLIELDLSSNKLDKNSAEILAKLSLQTLSLAGNDCGDDLPIALSTSATLINLTLSHNKIRAEGAKALAKSQSIKNLILNNNFIQYEGVVALAGNSVLQSLGIGSNKINVKGMIALGTINTTLTSLDVSYNWITDEGFIALSNHPRLIHLNAGYNQITVKGARGFVEINSIMLTLILSHNSLGDPGAVALFKHPTIRTLDLTGNGIGFNGAYAAFANKTVTSLTLSTNQIGSAGGVLLAQNTFLQELLLSYNSIGDEAATMFAVNTTLRVLNLNYNNISSIGRDLLNNNKTITKLILSEEQPPEFTNENLDTIFTLAENIWCISDLEGVLQFFNPAFSRVLGYSSDTLLAISAYDFLHPEDKLSQEHLRDEKVPFHSFTNRYRCADGSWRTIKWTSSVKHQRRYAGGTDITDLVLIQESASLAYETNSINLLKKSNEHIEQQKKFISHLSHEIRNPLSGIIGFLEICAHQIIELQNLINKISTIFLPKLPEYTQRLNEITDDLRQNVKSMMLAAEYQKSFLNANLDIVQMSETGFELRSEIFNLTKAINDVISMKKGEASAKYLKLNFVGPSGNEFWVKGDSLRFKKIIINLLGNSIKFTKEGGVTIRLNIIELNNEFTKVEINVIDTGIGISLVDQGKLFIRYGQANAKILKDFGGSGLGLYHSREIAHAMHGNITLRSELEIGTEFFITLQFNSLSLEEKSELEEREEKTDQFSLLESPRELGVFGVVPIIPSAIKRRILVVEDSTVNRKILTKLLSKAGHTYLEAENGQVAIDIYKANRNIGVILMDVSMPIKDGIQATLEIRAFELEHSFAAVPIFAITGNAIKEDVAKGMAAGMTEYFLKPYSTADLLTAINKLPIPDFLPSLAYMPRHSTC